MQTHIRPSSCPDHTPGRPDRVSRILYGVLLMPACVIGLVWLAANRRGAPEVSQRSAGCEMRQAG